MAERVVDVRGLLCPEPVLRVQKELTRLAGGGTLEVLADSTAARENVSRLARSRGWRVEVREQGPEFHLVLSR